MLDGSSAAEGRCGCDGIIAPEMSRPNASPTRDVRKTSSWSMAQSSDRWLCFDQVWAISSDRRPYCATSPCIQVTSSPKRLVLQAAQSCTEPSAAKPAISGADPKWTLGRGWRSILQREQEIITTEKMTSDSILYDITTGVPRETLAV